VTVAAYSAIALLASCTSADRRVNSPAPTPAHGVIIPAASMHPFDRCMIDQGFEPIKTFAPGVGDGRLVRTWRSTSTGDPELDLARSEVCEPLLPKRPPLTEQEIRAIYARWVEEYECVVGLGWKPDPPPSVEKFVADWRTVGPWMPIDGVPTDVWSDAQYREAKERCTLEMFERD
jgi:hypothetical protein